jgi:crotonobetainyl-CoA:carnitine CoA-transferase CaiB-like acyl-CoA transferase
METETPAGPIEVIAPPTRIKNDGAPENDRVAPLRVPSVGEHTAAIRREFAAAPARVAGRALLDRPEGDVL